MIATSKTRRRPIASLVHQRIARGGERLWRLADFDDLPLTAVAQALSRLTQCGQLDRLSKGIYYHARTTSLGKSQPSPAAIRELAAKRQSLFPSGVMAANLLGFTTQNPQRVEMATSASSLPRKLVGAGAIIHTRRPEAWSRLGQTDAGLLDFLRHAGRTGELSPNATVRRLTKLVAEPGCFERLLRVAETEPPRVRAMLGALGEEIGVDDRWLKRLKASLNPLSRFDFGRLAGLRYAQAWQAKGRRPS
ncbi:MAG: hypothetical protein HKL96_09045 [Phycisphaerales bacterium]|nr:hypothetical protein [Phycisphaerales bacterium]